MQRVADHALSGQASYRDRLERARMALRLARWLRTPEDARGLLRPARPALRRRDFLRRLGPRLPSPGGTNSPSSPTPSPGSSGPSPPAGPRSVGRSRAALADWTRSGSDPGAVLRVEDVAAGAIARVLDEKVPVLLVVLDGMSWPVAHELLADLRRLHWSEALLPGRGEPPPPVVAAIPSVTELSRTSLLAGPAAPGRARTTSAGSSRSTPPCWPVASGTTPRSCSTRPGSPRGAGGRWPGPSRRRSSTRINRLVAAVINAVDDRLAGASQVRDTWSVEAIRPLGALLRAAREAGRAVVLASDHGHVWHRDAAPTPASGASEASVRPLASGRRRGPRRRGPARGGPGARPRRRAPADRGLGGRDALHGRPQRLPRRGVAPGDGRAAGAPGRRDGPPAHRRSRASPAGPRGGTGRMPGRPANAGRNAAPPTSAAHAQDARRISVPAGAAEPEPAGGPLHPSTAAPASRPAAGLAGTAGRVRRPTRRSGRWSASSPPRIEVVLKVLEALDGQGGSMTPAALARRVDVPAVRLDGLVAKLQRLLNLDGYDVLRLDRHRDLVELDVALLRRQFELE